MKFVIESKKKDKELYDSEKVVLDGIRSELRVDGFTCMIGDSRDNGFTKMILKHEEYDIDDFIRATAGTLYVSDEHKHQEVTVMYGNRIAMSVDRYDESQVATVSREFAEMLSGFFYDKKINTGGDAEGLVVELENQSFGSPITFKNDPLPGGWMRTSYADYMIRAEVTVLDQSKIKITIFWKSGNKKETATSRSMEVPAEMSRAIDLAWSQLKEMCNTLKKVHPGENASRALDQLSTRKE